jgi:hypothetical protein
MLSVVRAEHRGGYEIWFEFSDGVTGVVDLEADLWGPVFEPLRDVGRFKQFEVSPVLHTIVWENDADFAPEFLHAKVHTKV